MSTKQPGQVHQTHTPNTGQEYGHTHQAQEHEQHERAQLGKEGNSAGHVNAGEQHRSPGHPHADGQTTDVTVYIDQKPYRVPSDKLSGGELRKLSVPPIGEDKVIFRVVAGKGDDIQLNDTDIIAINMREANQGRHFFSDTIVASKDEIARRAYFIFQQEGGHPGHDAENWAKAEAQMNPRTKP